MEFANTLLMYMFSTSVTLYTYAQYYLSRFNRNVLTPTYLCLSHFLDKSYVGDYDSDDDPARGSIDYINGDGCIVDAGSPYSFAMVTDSDNKIRRDEVEQGSALDEIDYQVADTETKFITSDLIINDDLLSLEFRKEGAYNYYVVGNVIDHSLLSYFLREHYSDAYEKLFGGATQGDFLPPHYILRIIDNNVTFADLTKDDRITVKKDGFHLVVKAEEVHSDTDSESVIDTRDDLQAILTQRMQTETMESVSPFTELDANLIDPRGNDDMWNCEDAYTEPSAHAMF